MKPYAVIALALLAPVAFSQNLPDLDGQQLIVGMNTTYPPFGTVDADGNVIGFDVDLVAEICRLLNCQATVERVQPDAITASLQAGTFDFVASAITITPERAENILFTVPYFQVDQAILVRVGDEELQLEDIRRLGAQLSTTNADTAERLVGRDNTYIYDDFNGAVQALITGDLDGVVIDEVSALHFVQQLPGQVSVGIRHVESGDQLGLALKPGNELVDALDAAITVLQENGTMTVLTRKWFGGSND